MIGFDELGRKGWLGNTMFQYAALKGIASKHGYNFCIPPNDETRVTNYILMDIFELYSLENIGYIGGLYRHESSDDICHSTTFHFNKDFFDQCPDNVNISGFFQSEKWFSHISDDIKKDFTFKKDITDVCKKFISEFESPPLFLHVRRADYIKKSSYHQNLNIEYYQKALTHFDNKQDVLVFSDDIEWCKKQKLFESDRFSFSETKDRLPLNNFIQNQGYTEGALVPYYDLCLMTLCKGGIISNSTFSWWGAWLQENRDNTVVSPKQWFGEKNKNLITTDICPDKWIKIN